jgi:hypothetical protein
MISMRNDHEAPVRSGSATLQVAMLPGTGQADPEAELHFIGD